MEQLVPWGSVPLSFVQVNPVTRVVIQFTSTGVQFISTHIQTARDPFTVYLAAGSVLLIAVLRIRRSLVAPCTSRGATMGTGWNSTMRGQGGQC